MALSMAYSEALFVAMVAGMFLFAHRGDWLFAGLFGLGAALSRPTGAAAALGLAVAAAMAVHRSRRAARNQTPTKTPTKTAPMAATRATRAVRKAAESPSGSRSPPRPVALAGVPGYLLWVGLRVGDLGAWFDIQTGRLGHHVRLRQVHVRVPRATRCAPATAGSR